MSDDENSGNETLRWPTNLDHAGIVRRLVSVRETAQAAGLTDIVSKFENVESMPAPQIGARVVTVMSLVQDKPQYRPIATQLEMIAMNLKNLK